MQLPPSSVTPDSPVVFVSYSHVNDEHIEWVSNLSHRLRANGVDVRLDKWDVRAGQDLNLFMEKYGDSSARVLVILSDDYGPKADRRGEHASGVGTETTILSSTVYQNLGSSRVIPVIPNSNTVIAEPVIPTYLGGRKWIDFRTDPEDKYEELLRELHGVRLEAAPPLGPNPFTGTTEAQARAIIRNDPARWRHCASSGQIAINLNENSGKFTLGNDEARFDLNLDYPWRTGDEPGPVKEIRHLHDGIGNIGLVRAAADHPERFDSLPSLPMSNRVELTKPGDALVMLNRRGYWALLLLDDLIFQPGPNGYEPVAHIRFTIATDKTANLTLENLPPLRD